MRSSTQLLGYGLTAAHFVSTVVAQGNVLDCPLLGPVFPAASRLDESKAVQAARDSFPSILEDAFQSGRLDAQNTSFSISVFSTSSNDVLYKHHFAAPALNDSLPSGELNDDTIYRIGSISKLFTVYAILVTNGDLDFNQPITKYIPELEQAPFDDEIDTIDWDEVTVGSLADHLAGLPRSYGLYDISNLGTPDVTGLPPIDDSFNPTCGVTPGNQGVSPCDRAGFLSGLISQKPIAPTFQTPIYSNSAFTLLGYVLEKLTGQNYSAAVQSQVTGPLDLRRTHVNTPNDTNIITPLGSSAEFEQQLGPLDAAGSIYSTLKDLSNLGRHILNSTLLSKPLTRRWLKPRSHTSDPNVYVGAPWEIFRMDVPLSTGSGLTRPIDLYTKGGDVGLYSTLLVLDPDHGVGFTILTAGMTGAPRSVLPNLLTQAFIPAIEEAAREEADANYAGTYSIDEEEFKATLTLSTDDSPGLAFELTINDKSYLEIVGGALGATLPNDTIRFYPSGLASRNRRKMTASWNIPVPEKTGKEGIFETYCPGWLVPSGYQYGGVGLDEFEVKLDKDGRVESVTSLAFRRTLVRS